MDGTVAEASEEMDVAEVAVKMSGYLEKRGKFRLVATWKRYWFVLEGRLLLYYGSEQDYVNLSACRGSINMGLVSCVRPGSSRVHKQHEGFTIEMVTRTHLVVLRMKDRSVQEQWLQALLDSAGGSQQAQILANSGSGTLHFRYSMDALPTATKSEASVEEKQSTLPRPKQDSVRTRQQSIIKHIKRIGGKTYVGSLDTVLKVRNNAYGSGNQDNFPENNVVNGHVHHEPMNQKSSEENKAADNNSSPSETMNADAPNCKQESKISRKSEENPHTQGQNYPFVSDTSSCEQEPKVQLHSPAEWVDRGAEPNNLSSSSQAPACGRESDTSQDEDSPSEDDMLPAAKEGKVIENKLYHQNNGSVNKLCSSESNINTQNCQHNHLKCSDRSDVTSNEKEKQSENIATKSSVHPEEKHNSFTSSEDIYYSCYDKVSLVEHLKNEQLDPAEPELPPRPHMSSGSNGNRTGSTSTVMEDDGAEYYVLGSAEPPLSPSTHSATSSVEEPVNKKGKNKHGAKKKKKKEHSESENADESDTKVKRKISFIHRLMEKYHKKKSKFRNINDVESLEENDGTEYAVIDYDVIQSNISKGSVLGKNKQLKEDAEETHDKCAVNLCSAKSLLPNSTFQELQQRLRQRASPHSKGESSEEELDYEAEYAETQKKPDVNTPSVSHRKPVPVPRKNTAKSTEELTYELDTGSVRQASSTPPNLPPRRMIRPRSPWHDVPSNNSPVYGNYEEIFGARHRDSLLGTPEGYALIKNKWQAADLTNSPRTKGTQWNRELRQVTFPSRLGQRVLQWQEEASGDSTCDCCSHDDEETRTQHNITADVERHTPEEDGAGPGLAPTTSSRNSTGTAELYQSHSPQDSSRESSMTTSSVSNSCNEITLVAAVHYEDTCSLQDRDRYDEGSVGLEMVTHETTNQEPNIESAEKSKFKRGANTHKSVESTTLNILRSSSDEQLSTDGPGKCSKMENISPFENKCDNLSPVITKSLSKQTNAEGSTAAQCEGNAMSVGNETLEFTSVCDIILKDSHPCSRESIKKSHCSINCASVNEKINEEIDPDSLMSDNTSKCSGNFCDKQEHDQNCELCHEPNWNMCKCMSKESCKNCTKKMSNKSLPDSHSLDESNSKLHGDSLEIFEEVELRKHAGASSSNVAHTATSDGSTCPTCSSKAVSAGRKVFFDGTKAIQCIRYDDDGCITDRQVVPVTKRYSDELNLLLAQLAEITSAPLLSPGVTISLVDFPDKRKHSGEAQDSEFDEWAAVGPIRRRRHSDPDYDVPRPHRSLLQLQLSVEKKRPDSNDAIEATKFFGKTESCDVPKPNSSTRQEMLWPGHTIPETCSQNTRTSKKQVQSQSDDPRFSITPDSLELTQP